MTSADLESKLISAIDERLVAASVPSYQIFGPWSITPGTVRNVQSESSVAVVSVSVGTPKCETYTTGTVSFAGSVEIVVRLELDPSGSALSAFASVVDDLFRAWQAETYQQAFTALDIQAFSVGDFSAGAGSPPAVDRVRSLVSVSFPFSISGVYVTPANMNTQP